MISIITLTLYDYLLVFDDEVRRQSPGPSAPALHALLRDSVCLEGPQVMGFVPLFAQTVKGELICKLRNSFMPLYRGGSPRINRFGELLMDFGIAPRSTESDPSHRIPVLRDLRHKYSEETRGQSESTTPLSSTF